LEANTKQLAEEQRDQKENMERMEAQFHLYLRYVHHMDIKPADQNGTPSRIRKTCMLVQRDENNNRKDEGKNISSSWTRIGSTIG
jgi:hypothetical protein